MFSKAKGSRRERQAKKIMEQAGYYKQSESSLKKQILDYLRYKKVLCWNNRNTGLYKTDKFGNQKWIPAVMKGISDIIGILPGGRALFIEVKVGNNKLTPHQEFFLEEVNRQSGVGLVVYSLDELERKLREYL